MTSLAHSLRLRRGVPLGFLLVTATILAGAGLVHRPFLATGLVLGAVVLALCLLRPLLVVGAMLAIGVIDVSLFTGGGKLLEDSGGIDMNGIRLIGMTIGLVAVVLAQRRAWEEAFGRYGRVYLLCLLYAAGTLAISLSFVDGLRFWFKMTYPFLVLLLVLALPRDEAEVQRLADAVLVGGAAVAVVLNPLLVLLGAYAIDDEGRLHITELAAHQNPESFYFLVIILMALARYGTRRQWRYLGLAGAASVWIVLGQTRIALAAGLLGLATMGLAAALATRNRRLIWITLGAGGLLTAVLAPPVLARTFWGHMPSADELLSLVQHPASIMQVMNFEGRQNYWPVAAALFLSHPLTGIGLGSLRGVLLVEFPPEWGGVVHSEYLRIFSELGLIGGGLFSAGILVWWLGSMRALRIDDPRIREVALPAVAVIVVWAVTALTDNTVEYYSQFSQYAVFLPAATLALVRLRAERLAAASEAPPALPDGATRPPPARRTPAGT